MTAILTSCSGSASPPPLSPEILGIFTAYPLAGSSTASYIALGTDGALWFTEFTANKIGRITTAGKVTEFAIPSVAASPEGITSGPDGALWFAERDASKIGRITTAGSITEYAVPVAASNPVTITAGPDGALWFIGGEAIGRVTTHGVFTTYAIPNQSIEALDITAGPDNALWFTEYPTGLNGTVPNSSSAIGRIATSGSISEYSLPIAESSPGTITLGSDKALWFTDRTGIGRITRSGAISQYPLNAFPFSITPGPDGAIWATEAGNGESAIVRISPIGAITTYTPPASLFGPNVITSGPDGALWFTCGNGIGRLH